MPTAFDTLFRLIDHLEFTHYRDHAVLKAMCLHEGLTSKTRLYDDQRRMGGFRGVRSVAGAMWRLHEQGLVTVGTEQYDIGNAHKRIPVHAVEVHKEVIADRASRSAL